MPPRGPAVVRPLPSALALILLSLPLPVPAALEEEALLAEVKPAELKRHAQEIVKHERPSGSPGEFAAIDYIVKTLRAESIQADVYEFPAYVSDPVRASLRLEGEGGHDVPCLTQAFAASTGPNGLTGEAADAGAGETADYAKARPAGKIVLVDGLAGPDGVKAAEEAGAVGVIFVSDTERIHEMTVDRVWGTPGPGDAREFPRIPSLAIRRSDGAEMRRRLAGGPLRVRIETAVDTGWRTLRLPVATIRSPKDPRGFVLLGGHIDAWHHGATDEGASNAAMVEIARIFNRHREELERGLRVAWWPGHSNARYAGSTWYVDANWVEIRDHALAYLNVDGIGQTGASVYSATCTAEMEGLARAVLKDVAHAEGQARRPGRDSDQSFFGVGLPLLQLDHERTDDSGGTWWWHTPEDTFDKIDFDVLAGDARLYVAAIARLTGRPVPPLRLATASSEVLDLLRTRIQEGGERALSIDFSPAHQRAERVNFLAAKLDLEIERGVDPILVPEVARGMVRFVRPLVRVTYQERGPYHQDPALDIPQLPGLAGFASLPALDPKSDLYPFTRADLVRELNRLVDHLDQAFAEGEALAASLNPPAAAPSQAPR